MKPISNTFKYLGLLSLSLTTTAIFTGCSGDTNETTPADGGAANAAGTTSKAGEGGTTSNSGNGGTTSKAGEGGTTSNAGEGGTAGQGGSAGSTSSPLIPELVSLVGCRGVIPGPLCTFEQDGETVTGNCGGTDVSGTVSEENALSFSYSIPATTTVGAISGSCSGKVANNAISGECSVATAALGDVPASTATCALSSETQIQGGVGCSQLPEIFEEFNICVEGAAAGQETFNEKNCKVSQDACDFQVECDSGRTITGTATGNSLRFYEDFKALADAETPTTGVPAFLQGEVALHRCDGTLDGGSFTGSCAAGRASRAGVYTSVCSTNAAAATLPPVCGPLSPSTGEMLFVLDSCDAMKNGEGSSPGIGEPICAFRQNNCAWELNCGGLMFEGLAKPGETSLSWKLPTGADCEASFDAQGHVAGTCSVPGLFTCPLKDMPAVPGGEGCSSYPIGQTFTSRGCGNGSGDRMECRLSEQHGCNFAHICSFASLPSAVFMGKATQTNSGAGRVDFKGLGNYQCWAVEPTATDLSSDLFRAANEWIGDCETPTGATCFNNWDATAGTGFRGLQLFFIE